MTNRVVKVPLSTQGIQSMIDAVAEYKTWLKERTTVLIDRLASEGLTVASAKFASAVYDGTNDVSVTVESRGEHGRAVVAVGASVLFIEFGTGIMYPDDHPEAAEHGMVRGGYGKGKGKQPTWGYYGDPGTNGHLRNGKQGNLVTTHGNPANMAMYGTVKELRESITRIVREVFS